MARAEREHGGTVHAFLRKAGARIAAAVERAAAGRARTKAAGGKKPREEAEGEADALLDADPSAWEWGGLPDIMKGPLGAYFRDAAGIALAQVGVSLGPDALDQLDERALAWAEARGAEMIGMRRLDDGRLVENPDARWNILQTTRDDIRSLVADGVEGGWSPQRLSAAVRDSAAFSRSRANTVARTELAFAHSNGNVEGWRSSGVVEGKRSILGSEHDLDDECDDNAAEEFVALDDDFPSGDPAPPYHPNCVCDVVPVLSREGGKSARVGMWKAEVDDEANRSSASDLNPARQPTERQRSAGNYPKGHWSWHGMDISFETPAGSRRRPEWPAPSAHYGYFRGTVGADGEGVDVFVRPGTPRDWHGSAWVIDQCDPSTGAFDEHKIMVGWKTETQARRAYLDQYEVGWNGLVAVTAMAPDGLRAWLADRAATARPALDSEGDDDG